MDQATFAIGSIKKETKNEKRERLRRKQKKEPSTFIPIPKGPSWLLLPPSVCEGTAFWIDTLKGGSFFSKRNSLFEEMDFMKEPRKKNYGIDASVGEDLRKEHVEKTKKVLSILHLNQTFRWKWKIFITKARMLRFQKVNETDPITFDICKQPISIHIFDQRKTYLFEAGTIAKHFQKKLTNNDGHTPSPLYPRNPFTNEKFTLTQTISIIERCKEYGKGSWALEAFRACRYDILSFTIVHGKPLRLQSLHATMSATSSWDCLDTLLDFIRHQHVLHNIHYNVTLYQWAVNKLMSHEIMEQWRKYCIKWYELDILIDDEDIREGFYEGLKKKTFCFCKKVAELQFLRLDFIKSKRRGENGSGSS